MRRSPFPRVFAVVLGLLAALAAPPAAAAARPAPTPATARTPATAAADAPGAAPSVARPKTLPLPDGFRPEGITSAGATFFVSSLADGAIYRGDVRTGRGSVLVPGAPGRVAVGLDYDRQRGLVWAAGGPTGTVTAYDARTGRTRATYRFAAGFLNDLVVTRRAVYVTDSQRAQLAVIPLQPGRRGLPAASAARTLPLTGDFALVPNAFNANGIVAARGGRVLVLVQSATGRLFRVDPATGRARTVAVSGGTLVGGDGLERRGRRLYVARGTGPNRVDLLRFGPGLRSARVVSTITDPTLDVPSTVTLAAGGLYAVNARFSTPPTATTRYSVTRLPRR